MPVDIAVPCGKGNFLLRDAVIKSGNPNAPAAFDPMRSLADPKAVLLLPFQVPPLQSLLAPFLAAV